VNIKHVFKYSGKAGAPHFVKKSVTATRVVSGFIAPAALTRVIRIASFATRAFALLPTRAPCEKRRFGIFLERVDSPMGGGRRNGASRIRELRHWLATIILAGAAGTASAAESGSSRILYFEPLRLDSASSAVQQKSSQSRELQFDAYGRRFVVSLEPNARLAPLLQAKPGASVPDVQLYRGQVNGDSRSWARISITQGKLQGMLWDGSELYVIEPLSELRDELPADATADSDTTAIFRLADVMMTPGAASCGTEDLANVNRGALAYDSMVKELKATPAIMEAVGASQRLDISVLSDTLLRNRFGSDAQTRDEILRRLNNVDGIYSSQLGVQISVASIDFEDSFSGTTSASSLLSELGNLRRRSPNLSSRGLTHLFTGRNLDGSTVGIAYISSLCDRQFGAGLTESGTRSAWLESLIAAHEIGHNFGAPHDGDAEQACASTPTGQYLMSPSVNGNDRFSPCSLDIMQRRAANASCITPLANADVEVAADLGNARRPVNTPFNWELVVRNAGGLATADTRAEISLPSELTIDEAFVTGGTCISGGGFIGCDLSPIAGGSSATVQLMLRSSVVASHPISVNVSASNDSNTANNRGEGIITTQVEVDLGVSLQAPSSISAGTAFNATLSASNLSGSDADTVTLTLTLPDGFSASSASFGGGSCDIGTGSITCSLSSLAAGANATGTVTLTASSPGSAVLEATVSSSQFDPTASNDVATTTVTVTGMSPASQSGSRSGGGGGALGSGMLALLLAALFSRNLLANHPGSRQSRRTIPS
jgi:hypothetical protein